MITDGNIGYRRDAIDDEKHFPSFLITKVNLNYNLTPFLDTDRLSSDVEDSLKWQIKVKIILIHSLHLFASGAFVSCHSPKAAIFQV